MQEWEHSGLENREYGRGDPLRWPHNALYPQKLALTSLTSGGRSVGIFPLRAKATDFFLKSGNILWNNVTDSVDTELKYEFDEVYKHPYKYNYCVSGHYPSSCFYLKHNFSETQFCLFLQVEPTQLGPIDRASTCL
jgi:hypothetical protein